MHLWIALGVAFVAASGLIFHAHNAFYNEYMSLFYEPGLSGVRHIQKPRGIAWIEIDIQGTKKRVFEGEIDGQTYPLQVALQSVSDTAKISFRTENGRLVELADKKNASGSWVIYRNGRYVQEPLAALTISAGDRYTFAFNEN